MSNFKVVRYSPEFKGEVLNLKLREIDVKEVFAASGRTPKESLEAIINGNNEIFLCLYEDKVTAIFGVNPIEDVGGGIFFLATDDFEEFSFEVARYSGQFIVHWVRKYGYLCNYVAVENKKSIRWLKWLGANVGETHFVLAEGDMEFLYFDFIKEDFNV